MIPDWEKTLARVAEIQATMVPAPSEVWTAPTVLPPDWELLEQDHLGGARYFNRADRLQVILSCTLELDGRWWLHMSAAHRGRVPNWYELVRCKELFLGNRETYQVIPPRERYVNIHPNALHLFALADGSAVLPDFTQGTGSL